MLKNALFTDPIEFGRHIDERLQVARRALQETWQRPGVTAALSQVDAAILELQQLMGAFDPDEHPAR